MAFLAFFVLLITYVIAYWKAVHQGFSKAGPNALVLVCGALLLFPVASLGIWYFMIYDWPMNIGGKPNWTWYRNEPSTGGGDTALAFGALTILTLALVSLVYAIVRMLHTRKRNRTA